MEIKFKNGSSIKTIEPTDMKRSKYNTYILDKFIEMNNDDYLWYKLCVFYHAKTEMFDRGLTDLRSPYDPTEAYINGRARSYSNRYALNMKQFIDYVAEILHIKNHRTNEFNHYHYSAQRWINEYYRLKEIGEMDFIEKYAGDKNVI